MNRQLVCTARKESVMAFLLVVLMSFAVLLPTASAAGTADQISPISLTTEPRQWSMSLRWENDLFGDTDRFYTNGLSISLSHNGPSWMDPLADLLPWGQGHRTVGYDLTQAMVTPADNMRCVPDPTDRPYAGILSLGLTLHVEGSDSYHGLKLLAGVVGPWSFAGETQNEVHRLTGNRQSQGWDYQLENEPILDLLYEYRYRSRLAGRHEGWAIEVIPGAAGWLGNAFTGAEIAVILRAGYNIPHDFGPTLVHGMGHLPPPYRVDQIESNSGWGFSVYVAEFFGLVLRDITLDGNTFKDSPRVDKNYFVPAIGIGMAIGNQHFQTSFTYVFWGTEFKGQEEYSKFGSITFSYLF
jgi:lipid A 3-O-deacylase